MIATENKMDLKTDNYDRLLDLLRDELQEYGALLNLLSEQQESIVKRKSEVLFDLNKTITQKITANEAIRGERETIVISMLEGFGLKGKKSVKDLIPFLPASLQGLLSALVDEVFSVLERIKRKAQQNQMLANRLTQVNDEILQRVHPKSRKTKTYSRKGPVEININKAVGYVTATA